MRRLQLIVFALLLAACLLLPRASQAQGAQRCFRDIPGITNCIEGRFREYWEQNGGLPVFGYPITPATMEQTWEPHPTTLAFYAPLQPPVMAGSVFRWRLFVPPGSPALMLLSVIVASGNP